MVVRTSPGGDFGNNQPRALPASGQPPQQGWHSQPHAPSPYPTSSTFPAASPPPMGYQVPSPTAEAGCFPADGPYHQPGTLQPRYDVPPSQHWNQPGNGYPPQWESGRPQEMGPPPSEPRPAVKSCNTSLPDRSWMSSVAQKGGNDQYDFSSRMSQGSLPPAGYPSQGHPPYPQPQQAEYFSPQPPIPPHYPQDPRYHQAPQRSFYPTPEYQQRYSRPQSEHQQGQSQHYQHPQNIPPLPTQQYQHTPQFQPVSHDRGVLQHSTEAAPPRAQPQSQQSSGVTEQVLPFRDCTLSCKCHNREGLPFSETPTAHKVKYIGVRMRGKGRWVAEIKDNNHNVRKWLGTFGCPVQAAQAFDAAARAIRGPHTRANFKMGDPDYVASITDLPKEMLTEPLSSLVQAFTMEGGPEKENNRTGRSSARQSPSGDSRSPRHASSGNNGREPSAGWSGVMAVPPSHPSVGSCSTRPQADRNSSFYSSKRQGRNAKAPGDGGGRADLVICYPLISGDVAEGGQVEDLSLVPLSPEVAPTTPPAPIGEQSVPGASSPSQKKPLEAQVPEMRLGLAEPIPFSASCSAPERKKLPHWMIAAVEEDRPVLTMSPPPNLQEKGSPDTRDSNGWVKEEHCDGGEVLLAESSGELAPTAPSNNDAGTPLVFSGLWLKAEKSRSGVKRNSRIRGMEDCEGKTDQSVGEEAVESSQGDGLPEPCSSGDAGPVKRLKAQGLSPADACLQPAPMHLMKMLESLVNKHGGNGSGKLLTKEDYSDLPMPVLEAIVDGREGSEGVSVGSHGAWLSL